MPQAAIPALAAVLGGTAVAVAVATVIVYTAEILALNAIMRALSPRAPKPTDYPRTQSISDTLAHGKILYGMVCVGGTNIIPPISTTGTDPLNGNTYAGNWTHRGLALAQHEIDSFGPVRFEQNYMDQSQIAPINLTLDSGLILASGNVWDNVLHQTRYAMVRCYRGTATETFDYILAQADGNAFTTNFRSRGIASLFATFAFGDWFQGGVPPISVCVNGMKVYDPRKDSTNGGIGSHRFSTPSTWEWSNNPILCSASLIMFDRELGGGGYDPALDIDWPLASASANICDASVDAAPTVANLVPQGTTAITISGNVLTKPSGASAWDSSARSTVAIKAGRISFRSGTITLLSMAGLSSSPTSGSSFTDINYAWYPQGATGWSIYELGTQIKQIPGAVQATDIAEILYDGTNIVYLLNGKIWRQKKVTTQGMNLFFDSSFFSAGASLVVNQQRRYTCNLELDGAALFEDNLGYLIDASFGRAIDRDAKWRLYAGAWDNPISTINQSDWSGQVQIQAVTPRREGRWNGVRCFYYDPLRNWQRVECNARTNAAYKAADGGERIWQELDRPAIGDESTAQRMAEFTLRQSRNGVKVSGTLPPRFQYLAMWETVQINFEDLGWTGKAFRLMGYTLNEDGSVAVAFTEEQASDWVDMASSEFSQPDQHLIPNTNEQSPRAITSLVASSYSESIVFSVGFPALLPGETIELWEAAAQNTTFTGYTLAAVSKSDTIILRKSDNTSRYYRAWIRNAQKQTGPIFPAVGINAIEAHAGALGLVGRGVHHDADSAYKIDTGINADNAWDSDLISIVGYLTCNLRFKTNIIAGGNVMCGLSQNPGALTSYTGIQFAWYNNITDWRIYESGVLVQTVTGAVRTQDVAQITYDGTFIRYYMNGIGIRTVNVPGLLLFLDSSFYGFNDSMINSIEFGPTIIAPTIDTPQIGDSAATELSLSFDTSGSVGSGTTGGTISSLVVPAHDSAYTAIVTVMVQITYSGSPGTSTLGLFHVNSGLSSTPMQMNAGPDHTAMQYQFPVAAGAGAQTFQITYTKTNGATLSWVALSHQVEIIKR